MLFCIEGTLEKSEEKIITEATVYVTGQHRDPASWEIHSEKQPQPIGDESFQIRCVTAKDARLWILQELTAKRKALKSAKHKWLKKKNSKPKKEKEKIKVCFDCDTFLAVPNTDGSISVQADIKSLQDSNNLLLAIVASVGAEHVQKILASEVRG